MGDRLWVSKSSAPLGAQTSACPPHGWGRTGLALLRQGPAPRPCGFQAPGPRSDAGRAGFETPEAVQPSLTRSWPLPRQHLQCSHPPTAACIRPASVPGSLRSLKAGHKSRQRIPRQPRSTTLQRPLLQAASGCCACAWSLRSGRGGRGWGGARWARGVLATHRQLVH